MSCTMSRIAVTPAILIELRIEAAPVVTLVCMNDAEEARVVDWIRAAPGLAELVARAVELAEKTRAA